MKMITVPVQKYEAEDGQVFDTPEACIIHEKRIVGTVKTCEWCNGSGQNDPYGDGRVFTTCGACSGKGYLELTNTWK